MIIASRLLGNKKENTLKPPLIDTLPNFIQMPTVQFYGLLVAKSERVGLFEMCTMIDNWQNFDNLTVNQKVRFVKETIEPDYYSISNRIKRLFKNK